MGNTFLNRRASQQERWAGRKTQKRMNSEVARRFEQSEGLAGQGGVIKDARGVAREKWAYGETIAFFELGLNIDQTARLGKSEVKNTNKE